MFDDFKYHITGTTLIHVALSPFQSENNIASEPFVGVITTVHLTLGIFFKSEFLSKYYFSYLT